MQIACQKSTTGRTFKCLKRKTQKFHIEISCLLLAKSKATNSTDCNTYNECIFIYGPELGSYCFSPNSDVGLLENATENIQGKKQFAKFRMLGIKEGKPYVLLYLYLGNADVSNQSNICTQVVDTLIIYSWSRT